MATILSGIQPTGLPHLGNYFGAIRQHLAVQTESAERFYFIADFHALTSITAPEELRESVREVAATYLALGLDPEKSVFFRQSAVPEVTELMWLLSTVTGMGLLERAVSFKDKVAKGIKPNVGLFTYPVLMAADILAYDSTVVPVGKDQLQHLEMTQDMAQSFNALYGEVFVRPEARIPSSERMAKVPGVDGQKMSKSYKNGIWVFEEGKALQKVINQIVTDSRAPEEPKDPDGVLLVEFLELFVPAEELADWRDRLRRGGADAPGYGHLKVRLREAIDATFGPARARRKELLGDRGELERILARGAERARTRAAAVRDRAYAACGLR